MIYKAGPCKHLQRIFQVKRNSRISLSKLQAGKNSERKEKSHSQSYNLNLILDATA